MAILQIKGTKQEIKKMLDLFDFMDTTDPCRAEHCVELRLQKENGTYEADRLPISAHADANADEADRFITEMLTGVYND